MSSLTVATETAFWSLLFNGTRWPGIGQNDANQFAAAQLWVSLHNADPGEGGSQNTFETVYGGYARVGVNRVPGQWIVSGASPVVAMNANPITFPPCTQVGDTVLYWGIGLYPTGPGSLILSAPISTSPMFGFVGETGVPGQLTVPANTLTVNTPVVFYGTAPVSQLPGGIAEGIEYFVGTVSGDAVTLSFAPNNVGPVPITSPGAGILLACAPMVIAPGPLPPPSIPSFPSNGLTAYIN